MAQSSLKQKDGTMAPSDIERIYQRLDGIDVRGEKTHAVVTEIQGDMKAQAVSRAHIEKLVEKHDKAIMGNGGVGLKAEVASVKVSVDEMNTSVSESRKSNVKWMRRLVGIFVLAICGWVTQMLGIIGGVPVEKPQAPEHHIVIDHHDKP